MTKCYDRKVRTIFIKGSYIIKKPTLLSKHHREIQESKFKSLPSPSFYDFSQVTHLGTSLHQSLVDITEIYSDTYLKENHTVYTHSDLLVTNYLFFAALLHHLRLIFLTFGMTSNKHDSKKLTVVLIPSVTRSSSNGKKSRTLHVLVRLSKKQKRR